MFRLSHLPAGKESGMVMSLGKGNGPLSLHQFVVMSNDTINLSHGAFG